ncbi:hypothetical protein AB0L70_06955 [Kribbella sp. NPDC051952]|uniref:hypothetical protein n=1 Tax=Kribbella sp. NPDC051952 TaxID=3154851 RepID=UPI003443F7A8
MLKIVDGLTDNALDAAGERIWNVVEPKLGLDPAIQRLTAEARTTGAATSEIRAAAAQSLATAAAADPQFRAALQAAMPSLEHSAPASRNIGVSMGNANTIHGGVKVDQSQKIINKIRQNPFYAVLAVVALVLAAWGLWSTLGGPPKADASTVVGNWTASDGTGAKSFSSDGQCDGVFYNQGKPLDIGGPMTCALSEKPDSNGLYTLRVTQSMNSATYQLRFDTTDHVTVFDSSGRKLYELDRF